MCIRDSLRVEYDLRRLDHDLELQASISESERFLEFLKYGDGVFDLLDDRDLRNGEDPVLWNAAGFSERSHYQIESFYCAASQLFIQRLDSHSDERRKSSVFH